VKKGTVHGSRGRVSRRKGSTTEDSSSGLGIAVEAEIRVRYGDTDKMGVGYYGRYLEWFEVGRTEFFRRLGLTYAELERRSFFLPVVEVYCKYRTSVRYDDLLRIRTSVLEVGKASITFEYEIVRNGDTVLIATGHTVHGCVDECGKLVRLPEEVKTALASLSGS
jgi:acyl-CoA thioester hydrolase